jgi:hypothetical protein
MPSRRPVARHAPATLRSESSAALLDAVARTTPSLELGGLDVAAVSLLMQPLSGRTVDLPRADHRLRST